MFQLQGMLHDEASQNRYLVDILINSILLIDRWIIVFAFFCIHTVFYPQIIRSQVTHHAYIFTYVHYINFKTLLKSMKYV